MEPATTKSWTLPIIVITVILAIVVIIFVAKKPTDAPAVAPVGSIETPNEPLRETVNSTPQNTPADSQPSPTTPNESSVAATPKIFKVTGSNMKFSPNVITVNQGDRVLLTFDNAGGTHDLVIDGYNIRTKIISTGQSETLDFEASKPGTYEFYCSVGNHRAMGMTGTLIVK